MHPRYELNEVDRRFFAERLEPHLPSRILDAHRHICLSEQLDPLPPEKRRTSWASEVGGVETLEEATLGYRELFPGRAVSFLAFGSPHREGHSEEMNAYLSEGLRGTDNAALAVVRPEWSGDELLEELRRPGLLGLKPYQDMWEGFTGEDCSVFDFLSHDHLRLLDELGGWLTLHLPRRERLADPQNLAEVLEIRQRYPRIVLVVAHLGRSYAGRYAREGFRALENEPGILFDTSAVLNPSVMALALDRLGPERLMFGSDFPILYMRGRRRWQGDQYLNLTSSDYSWNTNRQPPEVEAGYTLYIYESMAALVDTCLQLGFGTEEMEALFYGNARRLMDEVQARKEWW
ncbi:MAG: amidohydrolase family protein [candidate division WS1 bacterium]|nr:amidohydrolase family protein [candidate division WS1 bacterium]